MATDYKQYNYSAYYCDEPFAQSACGPTAVADLLNISPLTTANWMTQHGYASSHQGTIWSGISACLTAYGGKGVQINSYSVLGQRDNSIFTTWKQKIQSGCMGILLMGAGRNNYWTNGGHYIAIVSYSNGKYLVYDPASAARTGWHSFDDFAGNIKICYYSETIKWNNGPAPEQKYTFTPQEVSRGMVNYSVMLAQEILKARNIYKGQIDGSFGDETRRAVIQYQTKRQKEGAPIAIDGICGYYTWSDLLGIIPKNVKCENLQYGKHGVYVILLQEILMAKGHYNGVLDGSYGRGTESAVRAFQKKSNIAVDGLCGPTTWKTLIKI